MTFGCWPRGQAQRILLGEGGGSKNNTIRGRWWFPQVWAMMSLVSSCLLVVRPCTKSVPAMH
jgi:hypothetical protein